VIDESANFVQRSFSVINLSNYKKDLFLAFPKNPLILNILNINV